MENKEKIDEKKDQPKISKMLHTSSNRGTPVSNDITKIVRQHYKPPSAKPYKHEVVQCRNEMYCKKDKPEDYWKTNYRRRQNNFNTGFYSTPWEPYKAVGGDIILDSFDLVASSLPGGIDKKMNPKYGRRGTVFSLTERLMSANMAKKEQEEKEKEADTPSEDLIDTCPTAGYENIKKFLKESNDRIIAVRSGMSYEEHVRLAEERMHAEQIADVDPDDMVIQSTSESLLVPTVQSPKFETTIEEDEEEEDSLGGFRMGTPKSILTGSSKSSASSGRRMSRSPTEKWRVLSPATMNRRMSVRTPPKKLSLGKVSSGTGTVLLRRERQCRDLLEFLTSIYNILTAIHNMKGRDLRVKVPLSREVVEKLQKESFKDSHNDGGERQSSRGTQMPWGANRRNRRMSFDIDFGSDQQAASTSNSFVKHTSMSNKSKWSRKMMSTDTIDNPPDAGNLGAGFGGAAKRVSVLDNIGKAFGRRKSRATTDCHSVRPVLETWEDFLNVQPQEYRDEAPGGSGFGFAAFGMQVGILSKFMRWYRRASVVPSHITSQNLPTIDKDQLRHIEEVREKGLPEKDTQPLPQVPLGTPGAPVAPSCPTGSALGSHERARKLPIWQQVANEKSTVFQNKKYTTANSPYTLLNRMKEDTHRMKKSLQKENTAALEKLAREKVANFRLKFGALNQDERSALYNEQIIKMQQAKNNLHRSHLDNFDVQPSKWYDELREKTQCQPYCDDPAICDMIIKLQAYCHMDNKTVPFAKAKLCLLTMSLPAYNICQIQTQKALKFIFEQVLLGSEAQFDEWLNHRKIPYIVQDPVTDHRTSLFSPTFRPYSPSRRTPSPFGGRSRGRRSPASVTISE